MSCFDLQKTLNVPRGETSAFYYKRALSVFNFTIFDIRNTKGYCYLWTEETAKKGANEIGSCLLQFIKHKSAEGVLKNSDFIRIIAQGKIEINLYLQCYHMQQSSFKLGFLIVSWKGTPKTKETQNACLD